MSKKFDDEVKDMLENLQNNKSDFHINVWYTVSYIIGVISLGIIIFFCAIQATDFLFSLLGMK